MPRLLRPLRTIAQTSSSLSAPRAIPAKPTSSLLTSTSSTPGTLLAPIRPIRQTPSAYPLTGLSTLSSPTPSILSAFRSPLSLGRLGVAGPLNQIRTAVLGAFYRPSTRKRKRKHGFLSRLRTVNGRKMLKRRLIKGRRFLSH